MRYEKEYRNAMASLLSGNQTAMFGGDRATNADLEALAAAQKMHDAGKQRGQIWKDTGWFLNPAGQWRYEIDDSKARPKDLTPTQGRPMSEVLDHPELFKAYPALMNTKVQIEDRDKLDGGHIAEYDPRSNQMFVAGKRPVGSVLSTLLHEAQHGVQTVQGDIDTDASQPPNVDELLKRALASKAANQQAARSAASPLTKELHGDEVRMRNELLKYLDYNRDATAGYVNQPAENEAFAVSARLPMSPQQRKQVPPWQSHLQSWPLMFNQKRDEIPEWMGGVFQK